MNIDPDQWLVDTGMPGGTEAGAVNMMNRKLSHIVDAYRAGCFWHQLQTVNPHIADLCAQQVKIQWGWAFANLAECQRINAWLIEKQKGREDLVDIAQWWCNELGVLLGECEHYDPTTAPAWCAKRIALLDQDLIKSGQAHGWLVGNAPAIGSYISLYAGQADQWKAGDAPEAVAYNQVTALHKALEDIPPEESAVEATTAPPSADLDFPATTTGTEPVSTVLPPLAIVEDRTDAQKIADGDMPAPTNGPLQIHEMNIPQVEAGAEAVKTMELAPTHCKSCGAALKVGFSGRNKARQYLYCVVCSDPARYYVVDVAGVLMVDTKPKAEHHQERTY